MPTRIQAGSHGNGGSETIVPPRYMKECKRSPRAGEDLSRAMTNDSHSRCSSAKSRIATMLSLNLTFSAPFPPTYSVLGCPGRERITPSQTAFMSEEEIWTLLAYGRARRAALGKRPERKSSVWEDWPTRPLGEDCGVSGGVSRPVETFLTIGIGED